MILCVTIWLLSVIACSPPESPDVAILHNADWTPIIGYFGIEMVQVPAGCFEMGHEAGRRDERPVTEICLDTFWIDRYEVTNAQYGEAGNFAGDQRPRENLTWFEARDFCASRDARLPTEAEWEYAASGPDNLIYPWGKTLIEDNLVFDRNSNNETADVGSRPDGVSWVGAYDMAGNVWEWVSDWYDNDFYKNSPSQNPTGPSRGGFKVIRGGSWNSNPRTLRSADRYWDPPSFRSLYAPGFRCAKTP
jgi:formylglycine-generating enzyme required for sulfatase activity